MSIKAICFDVGGTLVEFSASVNLVGQLSQITRQDVDTVRRAMNQHFLTGCRDMQCTIQNFAREIGCSPDCISHLINAYFVSATLYPESKEVLMLLKSWGYKLGIISNTYPWNNVDISTLGLDGMFYEGAILYSHEVGHAKPAAEIFRLAQEALGHSANELAMVGDSIVSDVEGASNAGWKSILIDRSATQRTISPVYDHLVIHSLRCLIGMFDPEGSILTTTGGEAGEYCSDLFDTSN